MMEHVTVVEAYIEAVGQFDKGNKNVSYEMTQTAYKEVLVHFTAYGQQCREEERARCMAICEDQKQQWLATQREGELHEGVQYATQGITDCITALTTEPT